MATTLFTDDDTQLAQPDTVKPIVIEQESLQAACLAKQDEIQQLEKQAAIHRSELEVLSFVEMTKKLSFTVGDEVGMSFRVAIVEADYTASIFVRCLK